MGDKRGIAKERPENATDKRSGSDRDTEEVVYAHLWCALHHDLDGDLEDDFADDVVMLEPGGVFQAARASRRRGCCCGTPCRMRGTSTPRR